MLREYVYKGTTWQFDPDRAPAAAVPVDEGARPRKKPAAATLGELQDAAAKVPNKAAKPRKRV